MTRYAAYIDESGNHDLKIEKNGASNYFLILAIIVPEIDVAQLEISVEKIRQDFFGPGEIKSSKLNDGRRIKIINALEPLGFQFHAVVVDKSRVIKDSGLQYKRSFIKFTNGLLYKALLQNFMEITIFADGHGDAEFIESFKLYIQENHKPDLFSQANIEIVDSKNSVLVQLADFLVGTTAKLYEDKAPAEFKAKYLNFLKGKRIRIDEWPPRFEVDYPVAGSSNEKDTAICSISIRAASRFLAENSSDEDSETRVQHAVLSYLLFHARFSPDGEAITSQEIISHLHGRGFSDVNTQFLRSNVISKLRDRDVVIASSPRGYKIPMSYADVIGFAELVDGMVIPLLHRLKRANEIFHLGSAGKVNFLAENKFNKLQKMLEKAEGDDK